MISATYPNKLPWYTCV